MLRPLPFSVPDRGKGARHRPSVPLMAPYQVFNGEQFDRLPPRFRVDRGGSRSRSARDRIDGRRSLLRRPSARKIGVGWGQRGLLSRFEDIIKMPVFLQLRRSGPLLLDARARGRPLDRPQLAGCAANSASASATRPTPSRKSSPNSAPPSSWAASACPAESKGDYAPYIGSWIATLENDERAIHRAASHAQRAADFLLIATVSGRVQEFGERPSGRPRLDRGLPGRRGGRAASAGRGSRSGRAGEPSGCWGFAGPEATIADNWSTAQPKKLLRGHCGSWRLPGLEVRLFVTDGSAQLRDAAIAVFGRDTYVQACWPPSRARNAVARAG